MGIDFKREKVDLNLHDRIMDYVYLSSLRNCKNFGYKEDLYSARDSGLSFTTVFISLYLLLN